MTESNSPTNDHFANPSPSHTNSFVSPQTDSVTNTVFEDAINYFHDTSTAHQSPLRCCPQKVVPSVLSTTPDVSVASGRRLIFDQSGTGSSKKLRANAVHQIMNHNRKQSKKVFDLDKAMLSFLRNLSHINDIVNSTRHFENGNAAIRNWAKESRQNSASWKPFQDLNQFWKLAGRNTCYNMVEKKKRNYLNQPKRWTAQIQTSTNIDL
eukprot:scaffold1292_cov173-Chaetoceros_neogracile.AAC.2